MKMVYFCEKVHFRFLCTAPMATKALDISLPAIACNTTCR